MEILHHRLSQIGLKKLSLKYKLGENTVMSISHYIKEIGRGKEGARNLSTEQAQDLMRLLLSGQVSDIELGAFCIAMRIKGETPQEMIGFLEAIQSNIKRVHLARENPTHRQLKPVIVIPSYNGARKLPLFTPVLAGALAKLNYAVLVHGYPTEDKRVSTKEMFELLDWPCVNDAHALNASNLKEGEVLYVSMEHLSPKLCELLNVRKKIGLRNSSHSLVKILNPLDNECKVLQLSSYTHPEYLESMSQVFKLLNKNVLFLRGTEGECAADPRRTPKMTGFVQGKSQTLIEQVQGPVEILIDYPQTTDPKETALYTDSILKGHLKLPLSIQAQINAIEQLSLKIIPQ